VAQARISLGKTPPRKESHMTGVRQEMDTTLDKEQKAVSLKLAIALSALSFIVVFVAITSKDFGFYNITKIVSVPQVFREYIAEAIGGSLFAPAINVAVISAFKNKRTPSTRRKIFIWWSVIIIAVQMLALFFK